jgi:hypothetical protein
LKKKILTLALVFLLFVIAIPSVFSVGEGEWIVRYRVEDLETGQVYVDQDFETGEISEFSPLFDGSELKVTFTVNVELTVSHVNLRISTDLAHSSIEDRYWQLHTQEYSFVDYNPNEKTLEFTQVKGTFTLTCYGKVPKGVTTQTISGYVLHNVKDLVTVKLTGPSGELLDQIENEVLDAEIDEYRNLVEIRDEHLEVMKNTGVSPGYVEIYESVIDQAETQAELGFVDEAISLLDLLAVTQEPASSLGETLFLPVMVALGVGVVVIGILYIRSRSKSSYVLSVIEDQIRDLEGVTLRVSKIDRDLASRLDSLKERLKKLVWT